MATILLIVIYICYIGLGLPDSSIGAGWPVMHVDFGVPVSVQGFVAMAMSIFTVVSSALSARAINRFGTGIITAVSTAFTAIGLLGIALSSHVVLLFVWAIPLGIGAGAIDCALNNYVALHYTPSQVNFLHCFYGVGVTLSPYLMSLALSGTDDWRKGFFIIFFLQAAITALSFIALPIWKRLGEREAAGEEPAQTLPLKTMVRSPAILWLGLVFITSCGAELVSGTWCSTYFVAEKGLSPDIAAKVTALFYVGMASGRFTSGLLAKKLSAVQTVLYAALLVSVALAVILSVQLFSLPVAVAVVAIFFLGFGVGPSFASLTILIPQRFGRSISQSIIGLQMALAYVGILVLPPVFGLLVQWFGAWLYPFYLIVLMALYVISFFLFLRSTKTNPQLQD